MLSWRILKHSINMVFNNMSVVVRIAIPLIGAMILTFIIFGQDVFMGQMGTDIFEPQMGGSENDVAILFASLIQGLAGLWVAVAWHRYVLLEETPSGVLPPFNGSRMLSYLGHGILLGLVLAVPILLVSFLAGMAMGIGSTGLVIAAVIFGVLGVAAVFIISARLYVILPAAAIGRSMKMSAAWEATKGYTGAIIAAYVLFLLLAIGFGLIIGFASGALGLVGALLLMVVNVVLTMIGASFLTTIYGVTVEGRELT